METFQTMQTPSKPTAVAPDGSAVRDLLVLKCGSMALFELASGEISNPEVHRTVDEIWYILSGKGQMWRKFGNLEQTVVLEHGVCLTIPVGTHFQWRSDGAEPLVALGVTMPPWPGAEEGKLVNGIW
jgi:mannose-6-phosphate isomerase-like protein (cupin superfamily)